jgi:hypothetical protein
MSSTVDPLVLLNISDHLTRKQVQNLSHPVCGLILGTRTSSGEVVVAHSIAYSGNLLTLSERLAQFRVIYTSFEPLGVYSVSGESCIFELQTLASNRGFQELYHLEVSFQSPSSIPLTLTRCVMSNGSLVPAELLDARCVPCKCGKIVISDLGQSDSRSGDWDAQLESEITIFERAKSTFNEKIGNILMYEQAVACGQVQDVDQELLEEIGKLKAELEAGVISGNIANEISVQGIVRMALAMNRQNSAANSTSSARPFQKGNIPRIPSMLKPRSSR